MGVGKYFAKIPRWVKIGAVVIGGLFAYSEIYDATRPVVDGEVLETSFSNEDVSRVKIRQENGSDLSLLVDTKQFRGAMQIKIFPGPDYEGKANALDNEIKPGSRLRAKVHDSSGIERDVYEFLEIYSPENSN